MITHACGLAHPRQLHRSHVVMNISPGVRKSLGELFPYPSSQSDTTRNARIARESRVAVYAASSRAAVASLIVRIAASIDGTPASSSATSLAAAAATLLGLAPLCAAGRPLASGPRRFESTKLTRPEPWLPLGVPFRRRKIPPQLLGIATRTIARCITL